MGPWWRTAIPVTGVEALPMSNPLDDAVRRQEAEKREAERQRQESRLRSLREFDSWRAEVLPIVTEFHRRAPWDSSPSSVSYDIRMRDRIGGQMGVQGGNRGLLRRYVVESFTVEVGWDPSERLSYGETRSGGSRWLRITRSHFDSNLTEQFEKLRQSHQWGGSLDAPEKIATRLAWVL